MQQGKDCFRLIRITANCSSHLIQLLFITDRLFNLNSRSEKTLLLCPTISNDKQILNSPSGSHTFILIVAHGKCTSVCAYVSVFGPN